jgi:hypothetical protein
VVKNFQNK